MINKYILIAIKNKILLFINYYYFLNIIIKLSKYFIKILSFFSNNKIIIII